MNDLFRRAQSILEAASVPGCRSAGTAIVLDRNGGLRILNSEGWTLMGIVREFGAAEAYLIGNSGASITVEGWSTMDQCKITQKHIDGQQVRTPDVRQFLCAMA